MDLRDERVRIELGSRSYDLFIGSGLLSRPEALEGLSTETTAAIVVTNTTIASLYENVFVDLLRQRYGRVASLRLPDGEEHKDWPTLQRIFDFLLEAQCDRQSTLFALGGGVVGDLTGFAAACYMRGVRCVQVPTTLLAMVDSSVGGKTGINHPLGKNMIGAFHQPERVIADLDTLDTLPPRELVAGLAEVIKYGPIADPAFMSWTEAHLDLLLRRDKPSLARAVAWSCRIKADVVSGDERESGRRAILNFGHTFAHAIEAELGYGTWLHGEAVGCGMVMAAELSVRLGLLDRDAAGRLKALVARAGLPVEAPPIGAEAFLRSMRLDKKAMAGDIRFVLLDGLGNAVVRPAATPIVRDVIDSLSLGR